MRLQLPPAPRQCQPHIPKPHIPRFSFRIPTFHVQLQLCLPSPPEGLEHPWGSTNPQHSTPAPLHGPRSSSGPPGNGEGSVQGGKGSVGSSVSLSPSRCHLHPQPGATRAGGDRGRAQPCPQGNHPRDLNSRGKPEQAWRGREGGRRRRRMHSPLRQSPNSHRGSASGKKQNKHKPPLNCWASTAHSAGEMGEGSGQGFWVRGNGFHCLRMGLGGILGRDCSL